VTSVAITGANGQLGKELVKTLTEKGHKVFSFSHQVLDISDLDSVNAILKQNSFGFLFNCAAFTDLDQAEKENNRAFEVNSLGAGNLALFCKQQKVKLIQISTDAVFSSDEPKFFSPNEKTNPVNVYGRSKCAGEEFILETYPEGSWIVRTSWLYGRYGGKFVHKILSGVSQDQGKIQVVNDQYGQPTLTSSLAHFLAGFISDPPKLGIHHFASPDYTSRFDLARAIFEMMDAEPLRIIATKTRPSKNVAPRPKFSLIQNTNTQMTPEFIVGGWRSELAHFISEYRGSK
jgi:dTDP-4-dehydrorhamnose reductase